MISRDIKKFPSDHRASQLQKGFAQFTPEPVLVPTSAECL